ncbi:hypothetical protein D3C83_322700 [compost metagenome]
MTYMFIAGAIPGGFLGNASKMFFSPAPPMLWLQGLVIGGVIGVVLAAMLLASSAKQAKAAA